MITNRLSKRLKNLTELVDGKRVVDVGCDHGKVINYLLLNNKIDFAVCSDISLASVKKAEELLNLNGVSKEKFSIRHGDGLSTVTSKDLLDTIIIAGMGGREIIKILTKANILTDTLILQPQKNVIEVKKYILTQGYSIVFDKIIEEDGKFYTLLKAVKMPKQNSYSDFELYFGKNNFENISTDFLNYLDYQQNKFQNLLDKVNVCDRQKIENMLNLVEKAKQKCRRV